MHPLSPRRGMVSPVGVTSGATTAMKRNRTSWIWIVDCHTGHHSGRWSGLSMPQSYRISSAVTECHFTDDCQLSKSMFVSDIQTGKRAMLGCIADVEVWCRYRGLKLNADKSEVLWLGTRQQVAKLSPADKDLVLPTGEILSRRFCHTENENPHCR